MLAMPHRATYRTLRCAGFRILPKQTAGYAQCAPGLLDVDRLGKYEIGSDSIRHGDAGLSFNQSDQERVLIEAGVAGTPEKQCAVLLVVAIDDNRIVVLRHQLLDCCERIAERVNREIGFAEQLAYDAGMFFIRAEQDSLVTHNEAIVVTGMGTSKLRR